MRKTYYGIKKAHKIECREIDSILVDRCLFSNLPGCVNATSVGTISIQKSFFFDSFGNKTVQAFECKTITIERSYFSRCSSFFLADLDYNYGTVFRFEQSTNVRIYHLSYFACHSAEERFHSWLTYINTQSLTYEGTNTSVCKSPECPGLRFATDELKSLRWCAFIACSASDIILYPTVRSKSIGSELVIANCNLFGKQKYLGCIVYTKFGLDVFELTDSFFIDNDGNCTFYSNDNMSPIASRRNTISISRESLITYGNVTIENCKFDIPYNQTFPINYIFMANQNAYTRIRKISYKMSIVLFHSFLYKNFGSSERLFLNKH